MVMQSSSRPGMIFEIGLPASVRVGEPVPITLRVRNAGREPLTLTLTGRPVGFDLVVTRPDGALVWNRLHGQVVALVLQIGFLQPGEALEFADRWEQLDNAGRPVAPGVYHVRGILPAEEGQLTSGVRELVVLQ